MDLLEKMAEHDLVHVVRKVFSRLTFLDVFNCRRTCNRWDSIVRQMVMSRWSEGQRCKYGWLTQPLRLEKVDLSAFLGDSPGVGGPARKVEVVLGEGDLRRKREVEVETTLLASVDLTSFCVVKQFLGLPGWQAEVGVFVGGHLSAVVKPSVPEEVAREVRFHVSFDDLVVTRRLVLIHGQVAMPRGHPIRSKDLLWVFDRSGGGMGEVGRHVLTEGLGNTTCFHFVKARDLVRVLSIVEDGLSAILSVRTINSLTGEPELTKCCSLPMLPYYNPDWLLESATCRFVSLAHRTQTRLVLHIVSLFTARPTRHVDLPNAFDDVNLGRDDRRVVAVTLAGEDKVVILTDSWREGVAVRVEDAESGAEERVIRIDEAVLVDGSYINAVANERILNCHLVCNVGSRCLLFLLGRPRRWQLYFDVETGAFSKLDDRTVEFPSLVHPLAEGLMMVVGYMQYDDYNVSHRAWALDLDRSQGSLEDQQGDAWADELPAEWKHHQIRNLACPGMQFLLSKRKTDVWSPSHGFLTTKESRRHLVSFDGISCDYILMEKDNHGKLEVFKLDFRSEDHSSHSM